MWHFIPEDPQLWKTENFRKLAGAGVKCCESV